MSDEPDEPHGASPDEDAEEPGLQELFGDEEDGQDDEFNLEELERAAEGITQGERKGPAQEAIEDRLGDSYDDAVFRGEYTAEFLRDVLPILTGAAESISGSYRMRDYWNPDKTPVSKDRYTWEHFKIEYYYTDFDYDTFEGTPPTAGEGRFSDEGADEEGVIEFDGEEYLGFDPDNIEQKLAQAGEFGDALNEEVERRTLEVPEDFDEDDFFTTFTGATTVVNRYDLEKAVPLSKKQHFEEIERYWVQEPFAFVVIYRSRKENETKYYTIEPDLTPIEENVVDFLVEKLRNTIKYADDATGVDNDSEIGRARHIEQETYKLLERYGIYTPPNRESGGMIDRLTERVGTPGNLRATESGSEEEGLLGDESKTPMTDGGMDTEQGFLDKIRSMFMEDTPDAPSQAGSQVKQDSIYTPPGDLPHLEGISARPEPEIIADDNGTLSEYQVEKIMYYLKRNFVGYERIDPIKNDINVEDISVDGYNSPVFVYHTDYEQIITNIYHGEEELDQFVVKLAQRSGKGISKRQPQVDCTLPDGSRAQLTLGKEVSDHGTNYTIRQFKDVPFTPVDLINWNTFNLDEMAFLWLAIENHKSLIFAGGTASGKTTSLNAVSIFIPSNTKIVSIEDTREVELPQRNWIASVTRPSFSDDEKGDIDEFDLLEAALRQRPDYIVMGEIRGEEGRTLFQVMSTGHTTYTTFHADDVSEVIKRFTTEPINVSKTMFTALDLVSMQTQTRVQGNKVRRSKNITEINEFDPENDEINVQDVFRWQAETDQFMDNSPGCSTLEEIKFDRGWSQQKLENELMKRRVVLAYLIEKRLNEYAEVAATIQAFINDNDTILALIADGVLEDRLGDLREMESVLIDIDQAKEDMVPRPTPGQALQEEVEEVLDSARDTIFEEVPNSEDVRITDAIAPGESGDPEDAVDEDFADADMEDMLGDEEIELDEETFDDPEEDLFDFGDTGGSDGEEDDDEEVVEQPSWMEGEN